MTDVRLPERWLMDRRVMRLNSAEFRAFVLGYLWSVSNRTDGFIDREDLHLVPGMTGQIVAILVSIKLWAAEADGWRLIDFDATQSSKHDLETLENARRADREKKARYRASTKSPVVFSSAPGDSPGDVSQGQHRQARQARDNRQVRDKTSADPMSWVTAVIPDSLEVA